MSCLICNDNEPQIKYVCGHELCKKCNDRWIQTRLNDRLYPTCHMCREPISYDTGGWMAPSTYYLENSSIIIDPFACNYFNKPSLVVAYPLPGDNKSWITTYKLNLIAEGKIGYIVVDNHKIQNSELLVNGVAIPYEIVECGWFGVSRVQNS